ncbi:MAG: PhoU domain-containing protein, partial [Thermoproteota archaeon]
IRDIIASYLAGFSRIRVEYLPEMHPGFRDLKRLLEEIMLGLILVEEGSNYMEFYVAVDPSSIGFWEAVGKAYHATLSMLGDAIELAQRGDAGGLRSIPERDTLVDRLYLYASRNANMVLLGLEHFHTLGLATLAEIPLLVMAVKSIERVADHTSIIAVNAASLVERGEKVPPEALDILKEARAAFETAGRALLDRSREAAERVAEIIDRYPARRVPAQPAGGAEVALLADSARRIIGYSLDIAEIVIDLESVRRASESSTELESG